MKRLLLFLSIFFMLAGAINFIWFIIDSVKLEGNALNGYQKNGRYYVVNHSVENEVNEKDWRRNRFHASSLLFTHPLAMLSIGYLLTKYFFPNMMYKKCEESNIQNVTNLVSKSGSIRLSARCGGNIGGLYFRGPLLKVAVYPRGIWFKPTFMKPFAILKEEVLDINYKQSFWSTGVVIRHKSKYISSPINLGLKNGKIYADTLNKLLKEDFD